MANKISLLLLSLMLIVSTSFAETFQIDPAHTKIHFSVKHLVILTAHGYFTDFAGSIQANPKNAVLIAATATIRTDSVDSQIEKRDNYLRGQDFFDVKNYPEISFKSKKVTGSGNHITMIGDLTIKGITREIILKGSFLGMTHGSQGELRARFTATGVITRDDFNLKQKKSTELMLGNEIQIGLEVESVTQIMNQ